MDIASLDDAVTSLSIWVPRGVVILSLVSHLVLAVFSEIRRRKADGCPRNLVWFAYQMTEWAPTYVLGNLYLETTPRDKLIIAFWLPFLLQHHARPDNISAGSMEDNKLWGRRMTFVPFQILGALYVLYRYILTDSAAGFLCKASWITFFLGIFKYVESAFALLRGNLDFIRSSFKRRQLSSSFVGDYGGGNELDDDEKALLAAHDLFDICKGAFSDYSVEHIDRDAVRSIFSHKWENMHKVVEMEISLMYDILYTKTPVVNTWVGYAIRVASPPLTAAVIVLFYLHPRDGMKKADFVITQILLWTTFLLDVRWLLRALVSTWTHSFLKARPQCWFNHEFLCQGLWKKLRCFVVSLYPSKLFLWLWTCECAKEAKSYRGWAHTFGQRNLLDDCTTGDKHLSRTVGRNEIEPEYQYCSREIEVPHYVMELVFKTIWTEFFRTHPRRHRIGMRLSDPLDRATARQHHQAAMAPPRPYEQQAEHWSFGRVNYMQDQPQPEPYEEQADHWRHVRAACEVRPQPATMPDKQYDRDQNMPGSDKHRESKDEDIDFPLEFQEAVLIWHITTNIFLSCSTSIEGAQLDDVKAMERLSDYMVFLVDDRPSMLPGLKLRSLYETARRTLSTLQKTRHEQGYKPSADSKKEKELAFWMLRNMGDLKGPDSATTTVWEGTQHARLLLESVQELETDPELESDPDILAATLKDIKRMLERLAYWIPGVKDPPKDINRMLEFISKAWVRLLIYASIRCSRESHANQLGRGGELTTIIWILSEHAEIKIVKKYIHAIFGKKPSY